MHCVQVLKQESEALGGDAGDEMPYPAPIEPQEDMIEAAGIYLQDAENRDENVYIDRSDTKLRLRATGGIVVEGANLVFPTAISAPGIIQWDTTASQAAPLLFRAQTSTYVTGVGGDAVIQSGGGPGINGSVLLNVDVSTLLSLSLSAIDFGKDVAITATGNPTWNTGTGVFTVGGVLEVGAPVAGVGNIRLTDTCSIVAWGPSSTNIDMLTKDSLDVVRVGGSQVGVTPSAVELGATSWIRSRIGGNLRLELQDNFFELALPNLRFDKSVGGAAIYQETHANTPSTMLIHAMDVTTGTGSDLNMRSGAGSIAGGNLSLLHSSGNPRMVIGDNGINFPSSAAISATGNPTWDLGTGTCWIGGDLTHFGSKVGFMGATPIVRPTCTDLEDLLMYLDTMGLIIDGS